MTTLFAALVILLLVCWYFRPQGQSRLIYRWIILIIQFCLVFLAGLLGFIAFLSAIARPFTRYDINYRWISISAFVGYAVCFMVMLGIGYFLTQRGHIRLAACLQLIVFIPFLVGCYAFIKLMQG